MKLAVQEEADANPEWYDHKCFVGMGDHYFQYDYTPDQANITKKYFLSFFLSFFLSLFLFFFLFILKPLGLEAVFKSKG